MFLNEIYGFIFNYLHFRSSNQLLLNSLSKDSDVFSFSTAVILKTSAWPRSKPVEEIIIPHTYEYVEEVAVPRTAEYQEQIMISREYEYQEHFIALLTWQIVEQVVVPHTYEYAKEFDVPRTYKYVKVTENGNCGELSLQ